MNSYITGSAVKLLRESRGMTHAELAERSGVSGKEISRNAPAVSRTGFLSQKGQRTGGVPVLSLFILGEALG